MKEKKTRKLVLKKQTLSNFTEKKLDKIKGGGGTRYIACGTTDQCKVV